MKNVLHIVLTFISILFLCVVVNAQTPTDAIMMTKGEMCIAAIYSHDSWDEYWEGTLLRTNGNIGTLTRQSISPMAIVGLNDRINFLVALPWMKTESSGGYIKGVSGLQDMGFWLKGKPLDSKLGPGDLTIHGTAGFTFPISNYLEDYGPYSLGLGCTDLSLTGILQYKLDMGLYLRGQAGYHWRGNSKIERDYYYTTHSNYSDQVDMPDAITWDATLGIWLFDSSLKIEATYGGLNTQDGFDIRRQDAGFPSNQMINTGYGGGFQYYLPGLQGFSVIGAFHQVSTGRNVGKSMTYTGGIAYFFSAWKSGQTESISN